MRSQTSDLEVLFFRHALFSLIGFPGTFRPTGQRPKFSGNQPNSNLGQPKLSSRLLGQTSNLGRDEPNNFIRPKSNFNKFSPKRSRQIYIIMQILNC